MCDACHVTRAIVTWWHDEKDLTLVLCGHHSHSNGPGLLAKGWAVLTDDRWVDSLPSLGPVTADPATH